MFIYFFYLFIIFNYLLLLLFLWLYFIFNSLFFRILKGVINIFKYNLNNYHIMVQNKKVVKKKTSKKIIVCKKAPKQKSQNKKTSLVKTKTKSNNKKILVVYYSRTNTTRKVAIDISQHISCDLEEINDTKDRSGVIGYLTATKDAVKKNNTIIRPIERDISSYDLIIIGTPIWAWTISTPIRTFINEYKDKIKEFSLFATMGGKGDVETFSEIEKIIGKKSIKTLGVKTKDVVDNSEEYRKILKEFLDSFA
jgi:flavodoxin